MSSPRLRQMLKVGPRPVRRIDSDMEVTFAPMESIKDGAGGLDLGRIRPAREVMEGSYNVFEDGDVLLAKVTPCFENGKKALASCLANGVGFATSEVHVLRPNPRRIDARFLLHLLSSASFQAEGVASMTGAGGLRRVSEEAILNHRPVVTDLNAQSRIAAFLDRETARIDGLIEAKSRLLVAIAADRASSISRVVTSGRDQGVGLDETSSPFLPAIPRGWRLWKLKHLARVRSGLTLGRQVGPGTSLRSLPYLRVANVQAEWIDLSDLAEVEVTAEEASRFALAEGDVLMNEGGDNDKLGRGAVWSSPIAPCLHQNQVFAARPFDRRHSEWISLATSAQYARDFFQIHAKQSTNLASISKTNVERLPIPVPPLGEMMKLIAFLDGRLSTLDRARGRTLHSIALLREHRAALVTAAVTGGLDVEAWRRGGGGRAATRRERRG